MILVLFGQPHSGKSTLAKCLIDDTGSNFSINIDGDDLRKIFDNKDYSREGRIKNLNRASDIATYLNSKGNNVILSLVYPYKESRIYLNELNEGGDKKEIKWVYLTYNQTRGREMNHVKDFESPVDENFINLNTSELTIDECLDSIKNYSLS